MRLDVHKKKVKKGLPDTRETRKTNETTAAAVLETQRSQAYPTTSELLSLRKSLRTLHFLLKTERRMASRSRREYSRTTWQAHKFHTCRACVEGWLLPSSRVPGLPPRWRSTSSLWRSSKGSEGCRFRGWLHSSSSSTYPVNKKQYTERYHSYFFIGTRKEDILGPTHQSTWNGPTCLKESLR